MTSQSELDKGIIPNWKEKLSLKLLDFILNYLKPREYTTFEMYLRLKAKNKIDTDFEKLLLKCKFLWKITKSEQDDKITVYYHTWLKYASYKIIGTLDDVINEFLNWDKDKV